MNSSAMSGRQFAEQEIIGITGDIWLSMLGLPTRPVERPDVTLAGATLDGIIGITGDWHGAVALQVPRALAEQAAGLLFGLTDREPSPEDTQDALGELTNMTGGNIKALLDGECALSLPAVIEGANYRIRIPGTTVVSRVVFECHRHPFVVTLLGGVTPGGTRV